MNRFTMSNLALLMSYKVSSREVEKLVDRLEIQPSDNLDLASPDNLKLAVVQLVRKNYGSLADYIAHMNSYVADAVNRRAQLVCFPAYTGVLPLTILPQFESALPQLRPQPGTGLPDIEKLHQCLTYFSDFMFDAFYHTMACLAARHRVYIMAGSALYFDDSDLCHRAFLFDGGGNLVGFQDKISQNSLESALQVEAGSEIKLFDTPMGPLSILIGGDAHYYETARVAKNLGARLLLHPTFFTGEYTPVDAALGLNLRVQESNLFGAQSVLLGDTGLGFALEGYSCVFGPARISKGQNGLLVRSHGRQSDLITAHLNLDRLDALRSPYRMDENPDFMGREIVNLF